MISHYSLIAGLLFAIIVGCCGDVFAQTQLETRNWPGDSAGFAEFNAELAAVDDVNLLKFPEAKSVYVDGLATHQTEMLTDGTAGVWVGDGRIHLADGRPTRIVFDLGRKRLIREVRVLTSNSDSRTNQDFEVRFANKTADWTATTPLPDPFRFGSGQTVRGSNQGPCLTRVFNTAGVNLSPQRFDLVEFTLYPTHKAPAGSPARADTANRGWTALVELQVLADPEDPMLFDSPQQKQKWLDEIKQKRLQTQLASQSKLTAEALQQLPPLRRAIEDLAANEPDRYPGQKYLAAMQAFEDRFAQIDHQQLEQPEYREQLKQLTDQFTEFRREALLANPILDFDQLLFVKRKGPRNGLPANWQSNSQIRSRAFDDSIEVMSLRDLRSASTPVASTTLFKSLDGSMLSDIDLHFDAGRLMFSMMDGNDRWQLWEIDIRGKNLRQITPSEPADIDNYDACYLPNDQIIFTSTACMIGVPCVYGNSHVTNSYLLDNEGRIRQLTFDQEHNWSPRVMNDGRVMYQRWEYADLPHSNSRILFAMNPDGTGQIGYYGSNSFWPNSIFYARPVPKSPSKFVAIVTGHHGVARQGEMILFDTNLGRHEADGVVQRIGDSGKKVEPIIADNLVDGSWPLFLHPYPLSEKYFLAAVQPKPNSPIGIYLVDTFDNMLLLHESSSHPSMEPVPLRARTRPPIIHDRTDLNTKDATIYLTDIYNGPGLKGIPRGTVKNLRLYTYGFSYQDMGGLLGVIGMDGPWDMRRVMGTVPVQEDGSAHFRVPANTPIAMQPLDEQGRTLQLMRSWMTAMPGEVLQCNGCHESLNDAPMGGATLALDYEPASILPWHGETRGFDYSREVQPVIDRYCIGCHDGSPGDDGLATLNLRGDQMIDDFRMVTPGNGMYVGAAGHFSVGYAELHRFVRRSGIESDMHLLTPMEFHASTTELVQMLEKGHHGVKLDPESWDRLVTWIDMNCPYHGTWGEQISAKAASQGQRRRELLQCFAGIDDDPEYVPPKPTEPVNFVAPEPVPTPTPVNLTGWPLRLDQVIRQQAELENVSKTLDLGNGQQIQLMRIPAGEFVMGSTDGPPDEWPPGIVRIDKPFWIGVHEISNQQYASFDPNHDSRIESKQAYQFGVDGYRMNHPEQPVVRISWERAMAFCDWLSQKTGQSITLPTEAQWEYAARAGSEQPFWFGGLDDDFGDYGNLADVNIRRFASDPYTIDKALSNPSKYDDYIPRDPRFDDGQLLSCASGLYKPNPWGLHDVHGNVAEWTRSVYKPYPYDATDGRERLSSPGQRVVRGGSWRDRPKRATASFRLGYEKYQPVFNVGFRIAISDDSVSDDSVSDDS